MNCSQQISDGGHSVTFHPCQKPAVNGGLCSYHLKVKQRREARSLAWGQERDQSDANRREVETTLRELGLEGAAYYNYAKRGLGNYERRAVVDIDVLQAFIKRILK